LYLSGVNLHPQISHLHLRWDFFITSPLSAIEFPKARIDNGKKKQKNSAIAPKQEDTEENQWTN